MTRRAWLGSAAVHAVVIAALAWCVERRPPLRRVEAPVEVEVVSLAPAAVPAPAAGPAAGPAPLSAGGGRAARASVRAATARVRAAREPLAVEAEDRSGGGSGSGSGSGRGGGGSGIGSGSGSGCVDGIGCGLGGALSATRGAGALGSVAPPPPPRLSRARPPVLLYPARDRPERSGAVFVADLTIDPDGYVTAVALHPGGGARRDRQQAADAVWRFRYSPALDDDGQPVTARIEQRFMVE